MRPGVRQAYCPPPTRESWKDLLIFEERLKQNSERLQAQRKKYEVFLISLGVLILYLAHSVFVLPSVYSLVHYAHIASFLVALVTLALFFVTGMYSEKIGYAHKFVPQANRALRPFNIYLNTRTRSRLSILISYIYPTLPPVAAPPPSSPAPILTGLHTRAESTSSTHSTSSVRSTNSKLGKSPPSSPVSRAAPQFPSSSSHSRLIPLTPIPPATNPRGELIFSSRVTPAFKEGYEKYRGDWERRRNPTAVVVSQGSWCSWVYNRGNVIVPVEKEKESHWGEDGSSNGSTRGRERTASSSPSLRGGSPLRLGAGSRGSPRSRSTSSTRNSTPATDIDTPATSHSVSPDPPSIEKRQSLDHPISLSVDISGRDAGDGSTIV